MTTGSYSRTKLLETKNGWNVYERLSRTWSGANSPGFPPRPKEYETVTIPSRTLLSGKVLPPLVYRRRKWNDSVARARHLGENAYSLNTDRQTEAYYRYKVGSTTYEGVLTDHCPLATAQWTANDTIVLIDKLREKTLGADVNFGVTAAEAPKAFAMIGDTATRIYKTYRSLRKGDVASAWSYVVQGTSRHRDKLPAKTNASNFWLQTQYGWKPLLNDATECAKFLAHQTSSPRKSVATAVHWHQGNGGRWFYTGHHIRNLPAGLVLQMYRGVAHSKQIRAILKDVNMPSLTGLTDPAAIAWELVPYSFVADWFIPIGTYLDALRTVRSLNATYVTTERLYEKHFGPNYLYPPQFTWIVEPKTLAYEKLVFSRSVSSSIAVPLPEVKPWAKSATLGHAVNAVALLISRFGAR